MLTDALANAGCEDIVVEKKKKWDFVKARTPRSLTRIKLNTSSLSFVFIKEDSVVSKDLAGLDCLVTVNKNNKLEWILDWVDHHSKNHGVTGLLLFNNRSDAYSKSELISSLEKANIKKVHVVDVDLPFGPVLIDRDMSLLFLQSALLNYARTRYFRYADCVLSCDIDELVVKTSSRQSIVWRIFGFQRFSGFWVYPKKIFLTFITQRMTSKIRHL